jgi:hypothetical protein
VQKTAQEGSPREAVPGKPGQNGQMQTRAKGRHKPLKLRKKDASWQVLTRAVKQPFDQAQDKHLDCARYKPAVRIELTTAALQRATQYALTLLCD